MTKMRMKKKGSKIEVYETPEKKKARDCGAASGRNYLTSEVAGILRISDDSVYRLIKSGDLVAAKIKGKHIVTGQSIIDYFDRMIEVV